MKTILYLILTGFLFIFACTSGKVALETDKMYSFKIKPQPIINSADLSPREYNFLAHVADTMKQDLQLYINIVSYREDGFYELKRHEHCIATELATNVILENGIEPNRITHRFGKADMDNNPEHLNPATGVASGNCILEIQLYYP